MINNTKPGMYDSLPSDVKAILSILGDEFVLAGSRSYADSSGPVYGYLDMYHNGSLILNMSVIGNYVEKFTQWVRDGMPSGTVILEEL